MQEVVQEVNLKNIQFNLESIANFVGGSQMVIPVIKADAYGHGANEVALALSKYNVPYFAVAATKEAILLRQHGIKKDILVLSNTVNGDISYIYDYKIVPVVSNFYVLHNLVQLAKSKAYRLNIHIKINTGMNRLGFQENEIGQLVKYLKENNNFLNTVGIMSHFSSSESDYEKTKMQFDNFVKVINYFESNDIYAKYKHISNSGGIVYHPNSHLTCVRPGIILYGYYPGKNNKVIDVKPAMSIKSYVLSVHSVEKGEGISYGPSFFAISDMRVAIVAFGYADGLFRSLSNKFNCIINNKVCKSVGTICMDMFACDIGDLDVRIGDEVIIMGESESARVWADELSKLSNTISYEILTNIGKSQRVKRVFV